MRVFQQVIDHGGFAAAARVENMSPASVTRLVTDLEQHLGARLLQRTTRKLSLTDAGQAYLLRVRTILQEVEEAEESAAASTQSLKGTLHLLATPAIASNILAPGLVHWRAEYPNVVISLETDRHPHLRVDEFDATFMVMDEGYNANVVARPLIGTQWILCAAPTFLSRVGLDARTCSVNDLKGLDLLRYSLQSALLPDGQLRFADESGAPVSIALKPVFHSDNADALLRAALDGAGFAMFSKLLVQRHLNEGALVQVLPDCDMGKLVIYAALPTRKLIPARTHAFLTFVTALVPKLAQLRAANAALDKA
jgi:DNA-binding transcriptional LysR family regulator